MSGEHWRALKWMEDMAWGGTFARRWQDLADKSGVGKSTIFLLFRLLVSYGFVNHIPNERFYLPSQYVFDLTYDVLKTPNESIISVRTSSAPLRTTQCATAHRVKELSISSKTLEGSSIAIAGGKPAIVQMSDEQKAAAAKLLAFGTTWSGGKRGAYTIVQQYPLTVVDLLIDRLKKRRNIKDHYAYFLKMIREDSDMIIEELEEKAKAKAEEAAATTAATQAKALQEAVNASQDAAAISLWRNASHSQRLEWVTAEAQLLFVGDGRMRTTASMAGDTPTVTAGGRFGASTERMYGRAHIGLDEFLDILDEAAAVSGCTILFTRINEATGQRHSLPAIRVEDFDAQTLVRRYGPGEFYARITQPGKRGAFRAVKFILDAPPQTSNPLGAPAPTAAGAPISGVQPQDLFGHAMSMMANMMVQQAAQ